MRHTGAHAPGSRANRYFDEFNEFTTSDYSGISGLRRNCEFTDSSITLADTMNYRFFQFVRT